MGLLTNAYNSAKGKIAPKPISNTKRPAVQNKVVKEPVVVKYTNSEQYDQKIKEFTEVLDEYKNCLDQYEERLNEFNIKALELAKEPVVNQAYYDEPFIREREENIALMEKDIMDAINDLKNNQTKHLSEQMMLLMNRIDEQRRKEEEALAAALEAEPVPDDKEQLDAILTQAESIVAKQDDLFRRTSLLENNMLTNISRDATDNKRELTTQVADFFNTYRRENSKLRSTVMISIFLNVVTIAGVCVCILHMLGLI